MSTLATALVLAAPAVTFGMLLLTARDQLRYRLDRRRFRQAIEQRRRSDEHRWRSRPPRTSA